MMQATARANANIALVKYWGKRDSVLNLSAAGSLSLTLDGLTTHTTVAWTERPGPDTLTLGSSIVDGEPLARVSRFLDLVRALARRNDGARVISANDFPTASGLASSSSAFAALALAATKAAGLALAPIDLSILARRGSGSAARSIFGGFVELLASDVNEGAHAIPLQCDWDVRLVIGIVGGGQRKAISSRSGMQRTQDTSPLYPAFLATVPADLAAAKQAISKRDLSALGEIAERSAITMHASALAARPAVLYFRGATVEALHAIAELRSAGTPAYATIDAGPHVKVLCAPEGAPAVVTTLTRVSGITQVLACAPGRGASLVE